MNKLKETKLDTVVLYGNDGYSFIASHEVVTTVVAAITGSAGLISTIDAAKSGKQILLANKESMVIAGELINKICSENNSTLIPVDSEHNAIFQVLSNNKDLKKVKKVILTASGGPFIKHSLKSLKGVTIEEALNHPNWKMGKKISVDSATMMNKVFEVIEAKNIFDVNYSKISILIHSKSYVHALIKFNNGQIKLLAHEPDMRIPIHNSLYPKDIKKINTKDLNLEILNDLNLQKITTKMFPTIKILNSLPKINSLYETALVTINDYFVAKFLENKINFNQLVNMICKYSNQAYLTKLKTIAVKNINDIHKTRKYINEILNNSGI